MDSAASIARQIPELAAAAHDGDPVWPGYVAAYATAEACRTHFPGLAALALDPRHDWHTAERLRIIGDDFLTIAYAAMMTLCDRTTGDDMQHVMAQAVLDLLAWHQQNNRPSPALDDGKIPF